jgi:glycosyltransferase involved in cell wall biosynthesis
MAIRHSVWLITSAENRRQIEAELAARPMPTLTVIFIDWPRWLQWVGLTRMGWEFQHYTWQIAAYRTGRRLHRAIGFDLVHHVTLGRYWTPSFLAMLPVPFVWGPVGGGESLPKAFWRGLGVKGATLELAREWGRWIGERDPFVGLTARRSALALATSEESRECLERVGARSLQVLSHVGLPETELRLLAAWPVPEAPPVRFISIGRLVFWKGFHLGLKAFARMDHRDAEYWIVGTGSALGSLQRLARQLGVADRVRFCGGVPRNEALAHLKQAHVLVHPSLHESGGMVCLEAMASGKPVICLDLGGPALQVTSATGFKIAASNPEKAVQDLSQAMNSLAASAELRDNMGRAGRIHAHEFDWRRRGDFLNQHYIATQLSHSCTIDAHEVEVGE